jgi:hypothetical protein
MSALKQAKLALIGAAVLGGHAVVDASEVPTYQAYYGVEYKGRRLGESLHSLARGAESDHYRFESVTTARGLARLVRPRPIVEQSWFEQNGSSLRPLEFHITDGTRKGDDNIAISFDWEERKARIETADGRRELPLEPGIHDRVTLQLALMAELEGDLRPGPHALIDDASVKTYRYEIDGEETLETLNGTYETIRVTQRREGSSRHTIIWAAPSLRYLPVRIEQRRNDETLMTLVLESVQGL